jgi:hypothetical protein
MNTNAHELEFALCYSCSFVFIRGPIIFMRNALLLLLFGFSAFAQSPCNNTPAYSVCEISFDVANDSPYANTDFRVEFRSPRRRSYALPAYWDGGKKMVVRFAPTEPGAWDYHITSNAPEWNDKTGSFTAAASEAKGFLQAANMHHWMWTEKSSTGLFQPHLWAGTTELLFSSMDDAAFRALADARAAAKFNHFRGLVLAGGVGGQWSATGPNLDYFRRLDARVRYLNEKGMVADLVLAGGAGALTKLLPNAEDRRRFVRFVVGRYAAFNVTWQGVDQFDDYQDGRAILKEMGDALKEFDPYHHPRSTGGRVTSSMLLDDGWMDFILESTPDTNVAAIEHQLYAAPLVNIAAPQEDAAAFRHRLWNSFMDGQYLGVASAPDAAKAKAMSVWADILDDTRYWDLEPYFDVDGGRAVALEDTEYLVYMDKPGPLELSVEKHGYEVSWIDPATGESTRGKKFSGEHFTGSPPSGDHDWVLHVAREGRVSGMNKSYKFESREIVLQEVEANSTKVPFALEQPKGPLSMTKPSPFEAKITRASRATRSMRYLWVGDVAADHQGYRVLATGPKGDMKPPAGIAYSFPATMHLRLYGMNANGKVYELDTALDINP